jgi:hypothetical protein
VQQNKGKIESGQRQPDIPVDEAWSMMNELLDANLPVQQSDKKGFVIPKRAIVIVKVLGAVGCAAAAFVSFHHWVAPVWPFSEKHQITEIQTHEFNSSVTLQQSESKVDTLDRVAISTDFMVPVVDKEVSGAGVEPLAHVPIAKKSVNEVTDSGVVGRMSSVDDQQREVVELKGSDNQGVADSALIAINDEKVFEKTNVVDSLIIGGATSLPKSKEDIALNGKSQGSVSRLAFGLQLPIMIPTQGSDIYFMQTNGNKQPIMNFIPEFWMSSRIAPMQEVVLTFSPYEKFSTGDLVVDEVYRASDSPKHRHENMMLQSKVVLTSGLGLAITYHYGIDANWQIGAGLGYTRINKALIEESTYADSIPSPTEKIYRSINSDSSEWKYINPNHFTVRLEVLYNYHRWGFGTAIQVPLNQFVESDYPQASPVNWQLVVRYALWRKE